MFVTDNKLIQNIPKNPITLEYSISLIVLMLIILYYTALVTSFLCAFQVMVENPEMNRIILQGNSFGYGPVLSKWIQEQSTENQNMFPFSIKIICI